MSQAAWRQMTYGANDLWPNHIPEVESAIDCFHKGLMTWEQVVWIARRNGLEFPPDLVGQYEQRQDMWQAVVLANMPILDIATAVNAWKRKQMPDELWDQIIKRSGLQGTPWQRFVEQPMQPLDYGTLLTAVKRGFITEDEWHNQMIANGFGIEADRAILLNPPNPLPVSTLLDSLNRQWMNEDQVTANLNAQGYGTGRDKQLLKNYRFQWPTISDLIAFSKSQVFDEGFAARMGLDDDAPPQFTEFAEKLGWKWDVTFRDANDQQNSINDWHKLFWRASWNKLPLSMATEMLYRLRGDPKKPDTWSIPDTMPFTLDDYNQVLKLQNYPSGVRAQMESIAYSPPGMRLIRQLSDNDVITADKAIGMYMDIGYSADTAALLVANDVKRKNDAIFRKLGHEDLSHIKRQYQNGSMNRNSAAVALYRLKEGIPYGSLDEIQHPSQADIDKAYADPYIKNALATIDADWNEKILNTAVAAVKHNYLRGVWNAPQAISELTKLGIDYQRIVMYLQLWNALLLRGGKEAGAAKNVAWYEKHIISREQAMQRLLHLGYVPEDASLMLMEADAKLASDAAKAKAKEAKDHAAQIKAQIAAQKAAQSAKRQAMKALAASLSKAEIVKAVKDQLLSLPIARNRLIAIGIAPADADIILQEGLKASQKSSSSKGGSSSGNGQTGGTTGG
jgi:hypothetical protein